MKQHPKRLLDPHVECLRILDQAELDFQRLVASVSGDGWESDRGRPGSERSGNGSETRIVTIVTFVKSIIALKPNQDHIVQPGPHTLGRRQAASGG